MIIRNVNSKIFKEIEESKTLWATTNFDGTIDPDALHIRFINPDGEQISGLFNRVILDSHGLR